MPFAWHKPEMLPEALALQSANAAKVPILAGGTDLIVKWRTGAQMPEGVIDISAIDELAAIAEVGNSLEIGALVTHARIASSDIIARDLPVLAEACKTIGAAQIQNRGTIGGNIMNASPAGDVLPVLLASDAQILAQSLAGERWIRACDFFTGYRKTALSADEILTRIKFPKMTANEFARFYKIGTRRAQAISKVSMCACGRISHGGIEKIAIAIGSVAPTIVRAHGTEALITGQIITAALIDAARRSMEDEVHPIDDVRSTADYRRFVCGSLIERFLREATAKIR